MKNLILFDYLSISTKIHDLVGIKEMLGLENVPWHNGKNGKWSKNRLFFNSISINLGSADGWIWFEMSGQGCRDFETYGNGNYEALFQLVLENPGDMKITRLDVAYDDKMGIICMDKLCSDTRNSNFVSRFNDWEIREGSKGSSVCHGSMKSEIYLRIYDKAMERGFTDGRHWVRVELQLRRDRALQFIQEAGDIGSRFCGVLVNYVRYVEPDGLDQNKWRWPMLDYWAELCESAVRISLYVKPGTEYNLFNLTNYVFKQAGNAIDTALYILGQEQFMTELRERQTRPNPKYTKLKEESERIRNSDDTVCCN